MRDSPLVWAMRFLVDPARVQLDAIGWLFLAVICVLLPLGALRQHRRMAAGMLRPTRTTIYLSAVATHAAFVLMVLAVVRDERLDLFRPYRLTALHALVGLAALAIGLLPVFERFRIDDPFARERVALIAPRTPKEYGFFYLISVTAGVAEELTYRGLLFTLLAALTRSWWLAASIAAGVFGIVHLFQGWKSAGMAALMGLRDQIVVGLTGTLFVAIVVHTLHDAITGTVIGRRARTENS
jgi:membrane protease YdiL (CAAX protease family)